MLDISELSSKVAEKRKNHTQFLASTSKSDQVMEPNELSTPNGDCLTLSPKPKIDIADTPEELTPSPATAVIKALQKSGSFTADVLQILFILASIYNIKRFALRSVEFFRLIKRHNPDLEYNRLITDSIRSVFYLKNDEKESTVTRPTERISLESLPDETFLRILRYLPSTSIVSFSETNHRFNRLCKDNHLWRQVFFRDFRTSYAYRYSLYKSQSMNSLKSSASSSPTSSDPPTPPEQDFYQIYQLRYFNSYIHYLSVSHLLVSTKEYHQGYRNSIIRHEFRKSLQLLPHLFLTPFKLLSLLTLPIHYYSSFRIFYCPQPFKGAITLPRIYGRELATISKSVLNVWDIQWLFISSTLCFCLVLMNDVSMVLALVYSISSRLLFSTACRIGRVSSVLEKLLTLVSSSISKLLALELTALPISYFYQSSVTGAILRWTTWMSATSNGWLPFEAHIYKFVEHYFGLWQPGLAGRWLCYCMWFWVSVTVQQHYTYFKSRILSS